LDRIKRIARMEEEVFARRSGDAEAGELEVTTNLTICRGKSALEGTPRPALVRGFPMWGKQKKKGASRDAPANMGWSVVGREARPRSSAMRLNGCWVAAIEDG